jgi:hypothetical protein
MPWNTVYSTPHLDPDIPGQSYNPDAIYTRDTISPSVEMQPPFESMPHSELTGELRCAPIHSIMPREQVTYLVTMFFEFVYLYVGSS